jgi:Phosphoglycerate dehydrogenase and related dehydrogenases
MTNGNATAYADRPRVAFAMGSDELRASLFPAEVMARLGECAEIVRARAMTEFSSPAAEATLAGLDALITGWECPRIDAGVLDLAPGLRLIAHAGGTVKPHIDAEAWRRGVRVTSAAAANAWPVAEFTLGCILLSGKKAFDAAAALSGQQGGFARQALSDDVGNYRTTVGIIGASRVGRLVLELLRPFNFTLLLATPELSAEQARVLGARLVSLDELMAKSRIVSLHAPLLPATIGMIDRTRLASMHDGAVFINTARGALVDHDALRDELGRGRISAVLDVTEPEPLPADDPLYSLPNVTLTPHIAGSMGNELPMLGEAAVAEIERLASGKPCLFPVGLDELDRIA